jgi:hypothetical protein
MRLALQGHVVALLLLRALRCGVGASYSALGLQAGFLPHFAPPFPLSSAASRPAAHHSNFHPEAPFSKIEQAGLKGAGQARGLGLITRRGAARQVGVGMRARLLPFKP